ncbi:TonB-dependent receptor [uncultured Selenomonas sp.]|uniref:TonB-dependent receptor plug domain-containing protein n=1 Tax=uncultured Selenomonas sp. TaxID=159275 RepID=UPI0025FDC05A|nr:TonB-dependent receptor [uncultured Selenomonas sp.]
MRMRNRLRKRRYAALGAAIWMLWGSSALCAAEGDNGSSSEHVTTKTVDVEANYEKELLKEEPETKTIITREDLDRKGARTLSDALAAEQDIQMGTDNMGRKTIAIRGAEARHTLILVDGRRLAGGLSKYYGATDEANRIGVDNIDHIEVIRGSGTARYGADAIGGVINIVTKMPHKMGGTLTTEGSWIGEGGSQYNHSVNFATGEIGKGIYMDFSLGRNKTAPFLYDNDGTSMQYYGERMPMSGRVEFTIGKGETLTLAADRQTEDLQKDTVLGRFSGGKSIGMVATEDAWRNNFSIDWKKQTSLADYRVRFYQTEHDSDVNYDVAGKGMPYRYFYFDNFNRRDNVLEASVGLMPHDKHYMTVGAEYHDESGEGTRITVPGQTPRQETRIYTIPGDKRSFTGYIYETSLNYYSAYVMDSWQVGKNLLVVPSLRYTNHSHFGVNLSPSIGATYKVRPDLRVKANIGTSFATGGIAELYHDWEMYEPSLNATPPIRNGWLFEGNPELKPEKALNMDLSVEKDFDKKTHAKLTLFRNDFDDYMQIVYAGEKDSKNLYGRTYYDTHIRYPDPWGWSDYQDLVNALNAASNWNDVENNVVGDSEYAKGIPATDDVYTYKNISKARTQGVELEATREISRDFSVKFGYTFLDAKDRNTNKRLEGRARHMLNLTLNYNDRKNGWRATFWGDYAWNYLDIRDRIFTGRIIGDDGVQELEQTEFTNPNTGEVYHLFKNEEDAKKYMRGDIQHNYTREKVAREKNYGVWNLMFEKDVTKNATVYAGITNVFNTYDPYLGLGGRVYRLGMRMTF